MARDYVVIIDKSGSMSSKDCPGGKSRWDYCQESVFALANKCDGLDPDGIDLYVFNSGFKKYPNTTAAKVKNIFAENDPIGATMLAPVLKDALDNYFKSKANPVTIVVITDGEAGDADETAKTIIAATKKMDADEEIGIQLIQIGKDPDASKFLKKLDDDLEKMGAKFDIVDTMTCEEVENTPLSEVLERAISD
jgi:hypothetical protein